MTQPTFLDRLDDECVELMHEVTERGLRARLLGGLAVRLLLGDRLHPTFRRPHNDIDLIVRRKDARELEALLAARGWAPEVSFNALNGARRLLFQDPASSAQVDVFVEVFEMCHTLPLGERLEAEGASVPATELFASKLQIVRLNAKDRSDLYALLYGCEVADGDTHALEPSVFGRMVAGDWGTYHTFELNLEHLQSAVGETQLDAGQRQTILERIGQLEHAMREVPKTRGWKLRARIGERKRWFDEPEEVDRAVDDA